MRKFHHVSVVSFVLSTLCLFGCPDDLVEGGGGATEGTTTTAADSSTSSADVSTSAGEASTSGGADGTTTGDPPEPPPAVPVDCAAEYGELPVLGSLAMLKETPVASVPASLDCTDIESLADYDIHVYRPTPWPERMGEDPNPRPWVLLQHGRDQDADEYEHLAEGLVERGFVVFAPEATGNFNGVEIGMSNRVRCSLRWIRNEYEPQPEAGEIAEDMSPLGECYGLIGHSRGGAGVTLAAQREQEDGTGGPVGAVVSMAPSTSQDLLPLLAERSFAYLSLVSTTDEDQPSGGYEAYEVVGDERRLDQDAGAGSVPGRYGDKAQVVAYGVGHDDFGGISSSPGTRGYAVAENYVIPFFEWQFFEGQVGREYFTDGVFPPDLDAQLWGLHPQFVEDPLVLTSHQLGDRRGVGMQRFSIATYEDAGLGFFEGEGDGGVPSPGLAEAGSLAEVQDAL